jgi:hypothetical protein
MTSPEKCSFLLTPVFTHGSSDRPYHSPALSTETSSSLLGQSTLISLKGLAREKFEVGNHQYHYHSTVKANRQDNYEILPTINNRPSCILTRVQVNTGY